MEVAGWKQSVSECKVWWLSVLAGWVQVEKCALSRERRRVWR